MSGVDIKNGIKAACLKSGLSMQAASVAAGKNKHWLRGVAERNTPIPSTVKECARVLGISEQELLELTICETK